MTAVNSVTDLSRAGEIAVVTINSPPVNTNAQTCERADDGMICLSLRKSRSLTVAVKRERMRENIPTSSNCQSPVTGLDIQLSRQITTFHKSRHIQVRQVRYGRIVARDGENHYRWCFSDLLIARAFLEQVWRRVSKSCRHGLGGDGSYQAARDLLLREMPRVGGQPLRYQGETTVEAAVRLCEHLAGGLLAIQGPPGAGKTFTGAQMICELVRRGKTVGVTATSHKVILNLIEAAIEAADKQGVDLQCCHKSDEWEEPRHRLCFCKSSPVEAVQRRGVRVVVSTIPIRTKMKGFPKRPPTWLRKCQIVISGCTNKSRERSS
jgi:hypothetical protein